MRLVAWACALSLLVVGCGGDDAAEDLVELREPEDQASGRHVLGEGTVEYQTEPPTSGPHIAGPTPTGVLDASVPPEIQVRVLESGGVMVQYDDAVVGAELSSSGRSVHRRSWSLLRPRHCRRESSPPPGPGSSRVRPSTSAHSRRLRPNARPTPPVSTDACARSSLTPGNDLFESLEGLLQIGLVPLRIADHLDEAGARDVDQSNDSVTLVPPSTSSSSYRHR